MTLLGPCADVDEDFMGVYRAEAWVPGGVIFFSKYPPSNPRFYSVAVGDRYWLYRGEGGRWYVSIGKSPSTGGCVLRTSHPSNLPSKIGLTWQSLEYDESKPERWYRTTIRCTRVRDRPNQNYRLLYRLIPCKHATRP